MMDCAECGCICVFLDMWSGLTFLGIQHGRTNDNKIMVTSYKSCYTHLSINHKMNVLSMSVYRSQRNWSITLRVLLPRFPQKIEPILLAVLVSGSTHLLRAFLFFPTLFLIEPHYNQSYLVLLICVKKVSLFQI